MKCPYRKTVIHQREYQRNYVTHFARDIEEYQDCYENQCPFYISGRCMKAEAEMEGGKAE